jgi:hypothetical protein
MNIADAKRKFNIDVKFGKAISKISAKELFSVGYKYCSSCKDIKKIHKFCWRNKVQKKLDSICTKCKCAKRGLRGRTDYKGYNETYRKNARVNYLKNKKDVLKRNEEWKINNKEAFKSIQRKASAKRRASELNATPSWADQKKISLLYKKAEEFSNLLEIKIEVDHIIPLQGKNVCGLHVWENLQLLEKSINIKKSNKL